MKKYISLLLAILVVGCNVNIAKAATLQPGQSVTIIHTGSKTYSDSDKNSSAGSVIHLYQMTSPYNVHAYCEDANLKGPSNGVSGYKIDHILDETKDARDAGLIEILKGGDQLSVNIAIRAFNIVTGRTAGGSEFPFTTSAYYNLTKQMCSGLSCGSISNPVGTDATINFDSGTISSAKSLLKDGLDAYKEAQSKDKTADKNSGVIVAGPTFITEADGTKMAVYVFTVPEIDETQEGITMPIRNLRLESSSSQLGQLQYRTSSGTWKPIPSDEELYNAAKENAFKLEIGFSYEMDINSEDCEPIDFAIKFEGLAEIKDYIAAEATSAGSQRFLVMVKNDDSNPDDNETVTINGTIECGAEACDTTIETPICSDDSDVSTIAIKAPTDIKKCVLNNHDDSADPGNSYQLAADTSFGGISTKYCQIFCKEDYAEISFNSHIEDVKCLGTFSLSAKIVGSKDCYVASNTQNPSHAGKRNYEKSINIDAYLKDIDGAQGYMVHLLNLIKEYETKLEAAKSYKTVNHREDHCSTEGKYCTEYDEIIVEWPDYLQYNFEFDYDTENGRLTKDSRDHSGEASWSDDCNTSRTTHQDSEGNYYCKCHGSCKKGTALQKYKAWVSELETNLANAKKAMPKAIEDYKNVIKDFNSCTGKISNSFSGTPARTWESKYEFAQKLEWEYSEARYDNSPTPSYDQTYFNLIDKENRYLKPVKDTPRSMELNRNNIKFCDGDVGNEYSVDGCYSSMESVVEERTYFRCDLDDCYEDVENIAQATFIRIHFDDEETYETPTVFYQSYPDGHIANEAGASDASSISPIVYKIESKLEFTPLEKELAVSSSLVGGGLFKLKLQDLGEFYNSERSKNDNYGRLLDFEGDNQDISVGFNNGANNSSSSGATIHWNGEYICHYYSPCKDSECPTCEFTCVGADKCSWSECPTCEIECKPRACLFDAGELKASTKTISTTALANQTNCTNCSSYSSSAGSISDFREFGYNWNISTNIKEFAMVEKKAEETIKEISDLNTTVYDERKTDDSSLEFSITLTPAMIDDIKDYNSNTIDNGAYQNNTLNCYDYTTGGKTYENIFCYSTVIDKWVEKYGDEYVYIKNRDNNPSRTVESVNNNVDVNNTKYWTPWKDLNLLVESQKCQEQIKTFEGNKNCQIYYGGPSWK